MSHPLGRPTDHTKPGAFPQPSSEASPVAVRLLHAVAAIKALTVEQGVREVARTANVSHATLSRTINGEIWPSSITVASLEEAYGVRVWIAE